MEESLSARALNAPMQVMEMTHPQRYRYFFRNKTSGRWVAGMDANGRVISSRSLGDAMLFSPADIRKYYEKLWRSLRYESYTVWL